MGVDTFRKLERLRDGEQRNPPPRAYNYCGAPRPAPVVVEHASREAYLTGFRRGAFVDVPLTLSLSGARRVIGEEHPRRLSRTFLDGGGRTLSLLRGPSCGR